MFLTIAKTKLLNIETKQNREISLTSNKIVLQRLKNTLSLRSKNLFSKQLNNKLKRQQSVTKKDIIILYCKYAKSNIKSISNYKTTKARKTILIV